MFHRASWPSCDNRWLWQHGRSSGSSFSTAGGLQLCHNDTLRKVLTPESRGVGTEWDVCMTQDWSDTNALPWYRNAKRTGVLVQYCDQFSIGSTQIPPLKCDLMTLVFMLYVVKILSNVDSGNVHSIRHQREDWRCWGTLPQGECWTEKSIA